MIKKSLSLCAPAIAITAMGLAAPAVAGEFRLAEAPIEGQYIVVLKEASASLASENGHRPRVATLASEIARAHGATVKLSYKNVLRGFVAHANDRALAKLLADPRVAYVEEDGLMRASATQSNATWGLDRVDQRDLPLNQTYTYDTTASSVHAYIIDTGIRGTHNEFGGRVGNGYTAINDGNGTGDCNGHGTHVSGTVGGATWGVAKQVRLHPVRVLGCDGYGSTSGIVAGMDWVASNHIKPAVANMSLGGGASSTTDAAIARLVNAGVTVVVAAGNDNGNACNYSPARAASAITVGSTTSSDARSSFSNYGSCVDIFAPGSNIASTWSTSNTATNTISGTSMASPHVAGAAALYLATHPAATPGEVTSALINGASINKVGDVVGSPNRLLYSLLDGGGGGGDCISTGGTLANGIAAANRCGAAGTELRFTLTVPAGATGLGFVTSGGSGDADMYVRFGSAPTTSSYDCRPYLQGNNETCTISNPQAGTYHVLVKGYSAFDGLSLTGSYQGGGGGGGNDPSTYTNTSNYSIRDNATVDSPITVTGRSGYASSATPVVVDIRHTYRGDLRVQLVAPDGSTYLLKNYSSGDSADNVIGSATVNLSSESLNGTWKLRVSDNWLGDTGYINSWNVTF